MKCKDIMKILEANISHEYAEDWDNVGLLAGDGDREVKKIMLAVDALDCVIDQAVEQNVDMLITHHPLIFSPMKKITADHFVGKRVIRMIKNDIAYFAMHTNYDVVRMAQKAADQLGLKNQEVLEVTCMIDEEDAGFGRVGTIEEPMTLEAYARHVKETFELPGVLVYGDKDQMISKVAMCPGSGKSFLGAAIASGSDVYVTGDVDYHVGTDANERGIAMIDAGHYGIEHIFMEDMKAYLSELLHGEAEVVTAKLAHPYFVV